VNPSHSSGHRGYNPGMSNDRKKPGVAFWATVALFVVLAAYPLSFGPACWWFSTEEQPGWPRFGVVFTVTTMNYKYAPPAYWPIGWMAQNGPSPLRRAIRWYATRGIEKVFLPSNPSCSSWFGA
jgi:hypothetical protein